MLLYPKFVEYGFGVFYDVWHESPENLLGVEARMCVFRGENHELSRSGKPANRLARLREICAWFDAHL